jgi:ATP-binding cassette, subfamily B, vacuolar membrane transporter HMT1/ACLQ
MHEGGIAERGTHEELINAKGRYAAMWEKHCRAENEIKKLHIARHKAKKLLRQANGPPRKAYEDEGSDGYNSMASSTFLQTGQSTPHDVSDESHISSDCISNTSSSDGESSRAPTRRGSPENR